MATVAALAVLASPLALTAPAQAKAPVGLKVALVNSSTPVLTWTRVAGATTYKVQIDNNPGFPSPEVQQDTRNSRYVPTTHLSPGTQYWRVTAVKDGTQPSWASSTFSVSAVGVPVPTSPGNGEVLPQPDRPPLLRWQTSRGATSYTVEVDGDADFIGAKTYTTKNTSVSVPDALPAGDYFWRVTASLGQGLNSVPSGTHSFILGALSAPTLTFPVDDINSAVEDVVFDWEPVAGAVTYDLQVATDSTFNNFAFKAENVYGTRYSPPTTLFNDQFWWRVRAVDLAGQPTAWAEARFSFKRQWLDTPQAVYPTGSLAVDDASVGSLDGDKLFYQWSPVQHATSYRFEAALDQNFSVSTKVCKTAGTTLAPGRGNANCSFPAGTVHYWRVRAMDAPYPDGDGLPGIYSTVQKVKWGAATPIGAETPGYSPVTGLQVAMTGVGAAGPGGCTAVQCDSMSATPVFTWNKQPGIATYVVVIGSDENFTTSPLPDLNKYRTTNNYLSLVMEDDKKALAESEAGEPYFWYVIPCKAGSCGPSPVSQNPPLPGAHSFVKRSPAITGMSSSDGGGSEISFSWQDYFDTNQATASFGELGQQAAKTYRIQVDNEPSFAQPLLDEKVVDQATYTSGDRLYPEGTVYWRVQAIDAQDNGLTWSATQSLTKASPLVVQTSPIGGQAVPGDVPLVWQPQAFASAYEVEVYANNDGGFSPANRIMSARVSNPAYTPSETIPASASPYVWRVRRLDSRSNPGPWSAASFVSRGAAPTLIAPGNGALQGTAAGYFEWSDVPGAVRYEVTMRNGAGSSQSTGTVATALAPSEIATGAYTWQVTAFDASGKVLGASALRTFRIDADAPKVVKVKPGKLKATSNLKVIFSEAVKGLSTKTVKLKRQNAKGKFQVVKTKLKVKNGGKLALINPKGPLKKGAYKIVFKNSAIKDGAGNTLVDKTFAAPTR
ncbi:Ig-like domain-containing protein [Nocardioides sp.]|uniref:Ig-like domain-containing protein n=1 Tax=Nocardioides sp. TaxID=35761 RepID=UPI002CEC4C19|nr:Ig-like domain-containing protein [Nocardioides sp.]HXH77968.1 Ig-like domain-containing protein [Nocardioides sp.]